RIDTRTGEVTACEFALTPGKPTLAPGAFGVTVCARAGEGATAGPIGHYGLVASHHEQEAGVFRVDYVTGAVSNCYVYSKMDKQGDHQVIVDRYVVCTPMTK
ncbi:MAG: hypothetical protein KGI57_05210, partial [Hyphomicrobiales bacterium]|nr:hypothetical protein [Hyphomicrobiales bacterium]